MQKDLKLIMAVLSFASLLISQDVRIKKKSMWGRKGSTLPSNMKFHRSVPEKVFKRRFSSEKEMKDRKEIDCKSIANRIV